MKVVKRLEDDRYLLVEAILDGKTFIYLKDKVQKTESLGISEEKLSLEEMWKRHKSNSDYCLPCELLLLLNVKVITAKNSVAELGLSLEKLKEFKAFLDFNALNQRMQNRMNR